MFSPINLFCRGKLVFGRKMFTSDWVGFHFTFVSSVKLNMNSGFWHPHPKKKLRQFIRMGRKMDQDTNGLMWPDPRHPNTKKSVQIPTKYVSQFPQKPYTPAHSAFHRLCAAMKCRFLRRALCNPLLPLLLQNPNPPFPLSISTLSSDSISHRRNRSQ